MSAIIRACALLARSFESGQPGHAILGISPDEAREAATEARREYDALSKRTEGERRVLSACHTAVVLKPDGERPHIPTGEMNQILAEAILFWRAGE